MARVARWWMVGAVLGVGCGPTVGVGGTEDGSSTDTDAPTTGGPGTASTPPGTTVFTTAVDGSTTGNDSDPPPIDGDFGSFPDLPPQCDAVGPKGLPGANLPYVWVANTPEGTVSKVNTTTLIEEGRYLTAPMPSVPSSTSVALSGNMAVANRGGSVTMIRANLDECAGLDTSLGPADVLPFGDDDCVVWHQPLAMLQLGPVAWAPGVFDRDDCLWEQEQLWTAGSSGGSMIEVYRLDGETGVVLESVPVMGVGPAGSGPDGGVVDSEGNFWFTQIGPSPLVRIDALTLVVQAWPIPVPSVGLAIDPTLGVWVCGPGGVARFDHVTEAFDTFPIAMGDQVQGCASDGERLWLAGGPTLFGLRLDVMTVDVDVPMPAPIHAVAPDFQGFVWGVSPGMLVRADPSAGLTDSIPGMGLTTRSDMTGFALAHVTN